MFSDVHWRGPTFCDSLLSSCCCSSLFPAKFFFSARRNNFFGVLKISGITFNYCRNNVERLLDARLPSTLLFRITKAIHAQQEDFQSHRITVRLLYRLKLCCQEVKKNKQKGAVISIDFEKAFDSVWINGLLKKLHQSGVKDKLLKLIAVILKKRHLGIQIGNENTDCFDTKIELPQRSVIPTILFIFFCLWHVQWAQKFKFADYGNLLVIADTEPQLALNCQFILNQLEVCCRKLFRSPPRNGRQSFKTDECAKTILRLELRTEARDAHKALQNITTSTNALRSPNKGMETSAGSQQTT